MSTPLSVLLPPETVEALAERVVAMIGTSSGPEGWVGVPAVADHLACKPQRIYELARRKDRGLPHRREGSRLLFRLSEVDAWIERGGA